MSKLHAEFDGTPMTPREVRIAKDAYRRGCEDAETIIARGQKVSWRELAKHFFRHPQVSPFER